MKGLTRSLTTLGAVVVAGALIWFVPHYNRWSTGGYWGGMATFALAGLLLGAAQLRSREGKGKASFLVVFAPVLVVTAWVVVAAQPRDTWLRHRIVSWSGDLGVDQAVHNLGEHVSVLAFALGLVFGLTFELAMVPKRRRKVLTMTAPAVAPVAAPAVAPVVEPEATMVIAGEAPEPDEETVVKKRPSDPDEATVVTAPPAPL